MRFVADTGALLSLACSDHFSLVLKEHQIVTTQSAIDELKQFSKYDDFLGQKAKELLRKDFPIKNPARILAAGLDKAETDVFSLAKEDDLIALTDDVHAARIAKERLDLVSRPSFYLLMLLYKKKRISEEQLINDFKQILKHRNWLSGALWEYAMEQIKNL